MVTSVNRDSTPTTTLVLLSLLFAVAVITTTVWADKPQSAPTQSASAQSKVVDSETRSDAVRQALISAMQTNLKQCRIWLQRADFGSLVQTAEGMRLVALALTRQSGDVSWRRAGADVEAAVGQLVKLAKSKSVETLRAIENVEQLTKQLSGRKSPPPAGEFYRPPTRLSDTMKLLDATHADAKTALIVGEVDEARRHALVLQELAGWVGQMRKDRQWRELSGKTAAAAQSTADVADPKMIRQKLRLLYATCTNCHNRNR